MDVDTVAVGEGDRTGWRETGRWREVERKQQQEGSAYCAGGRSACEGPARKISAQQDKQGQGNDDARKALPTYYDVKLTRKPVGPGSQYGAENAVTR